MASACFAFAFNRREVFLSHINGHECHWPAVYPNAAIPSCRSIHHTSPRRAICPYEGPFSLSVWPQQKWVRACRGRGHREKGELCPVHLLKYGTVRPTVCYRENYASVIALPRPTCQPVHQCCKSVRVRGKIPRPVVRPLFSPHFKILEHQSFLCFSFVQFL